MAALPKETRLLLDPEKTARGIYDKVGCTPVFGGSRVAKLKSIKNPTMLKNLATAMEKDGVALTRFFVMVEKEYPSGKLTEVENRKAAARVASGRSGALTRASRQSSDGTAWRDSAL